MSAKGLLDSGATHPLRAVRKNEKVSHLPTVNVTLAGDKEAPMKLTETGVILGGADTEPIVPMGLLTSLLGCEVKWDQTGLKVTHPMMGEIPVQVEDGCPMVKKETALQLIQQIEDKSEVKLRSVKLQSNVEALWLAKVVEEHPAFRELPQKVKEALVEVPAESVIPIANRRIRKRWKKYGVAVHLFSGEKEGYTLSRALHEVGGDKTLLHELDLLHGTSETDLGPSGKACSLMLRLALDGQVKAWLGGPPCRTRSVLGTRRSKGRKCLGLSGPGVEKNSERSP